MKEIYEFRVREHYAKEFSLPSTDKNEMSIVRIIRTTNDSDLYKKISELSALVKKRDKDILFFGWSIQRIYTIEELESADLLLLHISRTFEPSGLECGTVYDSTQLCDYCGFGIKQVSELILDVNSAPKNVDIARTISNEIIINNRMMENLIHNSISGIALKPVHHNTKRIPNTKWYQLIVNSQVKISTETRTGIHPFDTDEENRTRCKLGHTIGLDILSELSIDKYSWDGSDIVGTKQLFGVNRGLLRTYPLLAVSQRLYRILTSQKIKGYTVEVVHLSPNATPGS